MRLAAVGQRDSGAGNKSSLYEQIGAWGWPANDVWSRGDHTSRCMQRTTAASSAHLHKHARAWFPVVASQQLPLPLSIPVACPQGDPGGGAVRGGSSSCRAGRPRELRPTGQASRGALAEVEHFLAHLGLCAAQPQVSGAWPGGHNRPVTGPCNNRVYGMQSGIDDFHPHARPVACPLAHLS